MSPRVADLDRGPLFLSSSRWNERHRVGTRVTFRNIFGALIVRRTTAPAETAFDGCAWVALGSPGSLHACRGLTVVDDSMTPADALAVLGDMLRGSRPHSEVRS